MPGHQTFLKMRIAGWLWQVAEEISGYWRKFGYSPVGKIYGVYIESLTIAIPVHWSGDLLSVAA
jgi:hypothetical protein